MCLWCLFHSNQFRGKTNVLILFLKFPGKIHNSFAPDCLFAYNSSIRNSTHSVQISTRVAHSHAEVKIIHQESFSMFPLGRSLRTPLKYCRDMRSLVQRGLNWMRECPPFRWSWGRVSRFSTFLSWDKLFYAICRRNFRQNALHAA